MRETESECYHVLLCWCCLKGLISKRVLGGAVHGAEQAGAAGQADGNARRNGCWPPQEVQARVLRQ